jgi:nitrite reductase (NADH) small subunit
MALRVRVCTVDQITKGKLRAFYVEHASYPVVVTLHRGEIVAFPGYCPHDRVELIEHGKIDGNELRCNVHGYGFDLLTGECEDAPWLQLRRFKVTQLGPEIWVDLM